jgi:hypothetical protein
MAATSRPTHKDSALLCKVLYTEAAIATRVQELGASISIDYAGRNPIVACVLNGGAFSPNPTGTFSVDGGLSTGQAVGWAWCSVHVHGRPGARGDVPACGGHDTRVVVRRNAKHRVSPLLYAHHPMSRRSDSNDHSPQRPCAAVNAAPADTGRRRYSAEGFRSR